jgi:beta-lactamase regulating signal transducer with metallopeptidase domain
MVEYALKSLADSNRALAQALVVSQHTNSQSSQVQVATQQSALPSTSTTTTPTATATAMATPTVTSASTSTSQCSINNNGGHPASSGSIVTIADPPQECRSIVGWVVLGAAVFFILVVLIVCIVFMFIVHYDKRKEKTLASTAPTTKQTQGDGCLQAAPLVGAVDASSAGYYSC